MISHPPGEVNVTVNPLAVRLQVCPKAIFDPLQLHPPKVVQKNDPEKLNPLMVTFWINPLVILFVLIPCTLMFTEALPEATTLNSMFSYVSMPPGSRIICQVPEMVEHSPTHKVVGFAETFTSYTGASTFTVMVVVHTCPVPVVICAV